MTQHPIRLITIDVNAEQTIALVAALLDEAYPDRSRKNRKLADHILFRLRLAVESHRPLLSERYGPANPGETPEEQNLFAAGALWWSEQ